MAKKQKTEKLTTIAPDILDHVTGGRGGGPGVARHKQPAGASWSSLVPSTSSPAAPLGSFANVGGTRDGQAGTAGTPGAYVRNGRFRPL